MNISGTKQIQLFSIVKSTILFLVFTIILIYPASAQDSFFTLNSPENFPAGTISTFKGLSANAPEPGPIIGDMLIVPKNNRISSETPLPLRSAGYKAGFYETSEYMIGDVAVGIIFLESNGVVDTNSENWDTTRENKVVSEIKAGLNWWAAREPEAKLTFTYDIHYKVPTGYEPISRPQNDESFWIPDAMTYLGYTGYPSYFDNVRDYNNAIRAKYNTDWAYTIFVVDSKNDTNGMLSDGYFAYAYLGGPFTVMTYDNDGYSIENTDAVIAHETGHIFYANDQYTSAGSPCSEITGYLAVPNQNSAYPYPGACISNVDSIMRSQVTPYTNGALDIYARQQIGWKDTDTDGIPDIIDFIPSSTLNAYSFDPVIGSAVTYTGQSTTTTTYPNNNPASSKNAITINKIKDVQYRVDGSSWMSALPADGSFNSSIENFTFTAPATSDGIQTIEVRALNTAGNWETAYQSNTIIMHTNFIKNPGFESGKTSWSFYTNVAGGTFNAVTPGYEGNLSARIVLSKIGTNMQLYQSAIKLEPKTRYRVSFAGKSNFGHDIRLRLFKQISPYPSYGLDYTADLTTNWGVFTTEFTTTGFSSNVTDGRLQFYLIPFAKAGDIYNIDDVRLEKVGPLPPELPDITTHPAGQTVLVGHAATFSVVAKGSSLSYQWQKNGTNISDALGSMYTTPLTAMDDNGATFRVIISNAAGSVTSNDAILKVSSGISNLINNPGFESGKTMWAFYNNGAGVFNLLSPGYEGNNAANLALSKIGTNMQLYQSNIKLEPKTRYRVSFAGRSTQGHDVRLRLFKQISPYPMYGLDYTAPLTSNWGLFTTEFNTSGFTGNVTDGRLQFYLLPFAKAGDIYNIDNVILEKVVDKPPTPPAVIGNAPSGTNVPVTTRISVNFSKPMNQASAQSAFFTIPATTGSFSWSGDVMTYTPGSNLNYSTTYNVTVGTGARDLEGNNLTAAYNWQFTTIQDSIPPEVMGNTPIGTNIPVNTKMTVTFTEAMNQSSVQSAFSSPNTTGTFSWTGNTVTYTPDSNLFHLTTYNVTVGSDAKDLAGNNMAAPHEWNFTTMDHDSTPPTVSDNSPTGSDVSLAAKISVNFSEAMNTASVESAVSISPTITGSFSWSQNTMTFIPDSSLSYGTIYNVTIGSGAMDLAGNIMASYSWQFTTAPTTSINLIKNPGFESGKTPWTFYTNGTGTFSTPTPGYKGNNSAMLYLSIKGSNMQFYQHDIALEPDTRYRLNFAAYSTTGHDMTVKLFKHVSPNTPYMPEFTAKLGTSWETFSTEFTTPRFQGTLTDARLQFWLSSFAASGDTYFIDGVSLEKVIFNDTTLPNITIWYGNSQRFGHIGVPQQWVNVLGNAYDISGIASLNYSLNNGITRPLSTGPDSSRLQSNGDFNIEINRTDLVCGDNQIVITATDHSGNTNSEEMTVQYSCGNVWPETYSINWNTVSNIQDAVQVVDGLWIKEQDGIRPLILGYDRLVAIGDISWDDYEIAVPVTINSPIYSSVPYGPNFGILMRWQGHYARDSSQPRNGWWPLGALGVYIWVPEINDYRLRIIGNNMQIIAEDTTGKHLSVGVPYMFKMRVQTIGSSSRYSLKVWEQSKTEPSGWTISGYGPGGELKQGSLMLNSHYVNVSFGNVTVSSGPFSSETPVTTTQEAVK